MIKPDCPGKQMQILREPVAVRHLFHCPDQNATIWEKPLEICSEKAGQWCAKPEYPDKAYPLWHLSARTAGAGFMGGNKQFLTEDYYADENKKKTRVIHPLYNAYCGYGICCNRL